MCLVCRLRAVHLNDSMMPLGSHKDRHAAIGEGEIGLDALLRVITHSALRDLPFYLETPFDEEGHKGRLPCSEKSLASPRRFKINRIDLLGLPTCR